jgi:hypothetical protein
MQGRWVWITQRGSAQIFMSFFKEFFYIGLDFSVHSKSWQACPVTHFQISSIQFQWLADSHPLIKVREESKPVRAYPR